MENHFVHFSQYFLCYLLKTRITCSYPANPNLNPLQPTVLVPVINRPPPCQRRDPWTNQVNVCDPARSERLITFNMISHKPKDQRVQVSRFHLANNNPYFTAVSSWPLRGQAVPLYHLSHGEERKKSLVNTQAPCTHWMWYLSLHGSTVFSHRTLPFLSLWNQTILMNATFLSPFPWDELSSWCWWCPWA